MEKTFRIMAILVFTLLFFSGVALSQQAYPTKEVRMIQGFAAGGSTDLAVRVLGEYLSGRFKQAFITVPKPGAAQTIAVSEVVRSSPDGYTIGHFYQDPFSATPYTHKVAFMENDLKPVIAWFITSGLLVCRSDAPYKNLKEFVAYAKKNVLTLGYNGTRGAGTYNRAAYFLKQVGVTTKEVPYEGDAPQVTALLGGHIDIGSPSFGGPAIAQVQAGKLRGLATFYPKRLPNYPDIPTFEEEGFPHNPMALSIMLCFAPKETPDAIVKTLHDAIKSSTNDPWVTSKITELCMIPYYLDAKGMLNFIKEQKEVYYPWLKEIGVLKE